MDHYADNTCHVNLRMGRRVVAAVDDGCKEFWYIPLTSNQSVDVFEVEDATRLSPSTLNLKYKSFLEQNPDLHEMLKLPYACPATPKSVCPQPQAKTHPICSNFHFFFECAEQERLQSITVRGDFCLRYSDVFQMPINRLNACYALCQTQEESNTCAALLVNKCTKKPPTIMASCDKRSANPSTFSSLPPPPFTPLRNNIPNMFLEEQRHNCEACCAPLPRNARPPIESVPVTAFLPNHGWRLVPSLSRRHLCLRKGNLLVKEKVKSNKTSKDQKEEDEWNDVFSEDDDDDDDHINENITWIQAWNRSLQQQKSSSSMQKEPHVYYNEAMSSPNDSDDSTKKGFRQSALSPRSPRLNASPNATSYSGTRVLNAATSTLPSSDHLKEMRLLPLPTVWVYCGFFVADGPMVLV
eukprot:GDKK01071596.1.p1 GENE.GDKK01071596.1~~GDKK01071596.1.p1  ORF type:complete len:419 (-),score=61.11 GDKK01071596.1:565-1797(-)